MRRTWWMAVVAGMLLASCSGGPGASGEGGSGPSPQSPSPEGPVASDAEVEAWVEPWRPALQGYAAAGGQLALVLQAVATDDPSANSLETLTAASQVQAANDNLARAIESAGPAPASVESRVDGIMANLDEEQGVLDGLLEACSTLGQECVDAGNRWTALSQEILNAFREIPGTVEASPQP